MVSPRPANEFSITRVYDAPVADVWEAWTDPEQVAQWWGPRGFTLTTHHKDFRVGGTWKYTMHGPDGTDYPNVTPYLEIVPHKKLVYDHGASEGRPPLFRVTVLFSETDGRTTMVMTMQCPTAEAATEIQKFIKQAGGHATWDRLAEYLAKQRSGADQFVINRSFAAPLELVFDMWTDPQHFSQWLAPTGFTMQFQQADIRPGGRTFYCMTNGADVTMYGRAEYLAVERPHRIVYTQQFCDARNEQTLRHPLAPTWPATMLTVVSFTAEDDEHTRVTVTWAPYGETTAEELATFIQARGGMTLGWTGSFDKLDEYLLARSN
jgi:uncharacterized protein YndB with AHSA1/START domain